MKATLNLEKQGYMLTPSHRKEKHFYRQFTAIAIDGEGHAYDAVTLRLYATDARHYCCLWVGSNCSWSAALPYWLSASGSAGGYGYHRASAAAAHAIANAGIELDEDINGRGYSAIDDAVRAIARALWPDESIQIYSHEANA
jgi:hypothetical protein